MSYLDPPGGQASSDDWAADIGGRAERPVARHSGAVPESPAHYGSDEAPDPYASVRSGALAPQPGYAPQDGSDTGRPRYADRDHAGGDHAGGDHAGGDHADESAAYPYRPQSPAGPSWDAPVAATSTAQAEFELNPPRRGRRRAGRDGNPVTPSAVSGRAGRNLGAAIVVGLSLGAVILAALYIWPPAFLGVVALAAGVGTWEMVRALRLSDARPPLVPMIAGAGAMVGLAARTGADGLTIGLLATVAAAVVWRLGDGAADRRRDLTAIVLTAVYVPFLLSFAVLLVEPAADGADRVVATVLAVVLSDTGGYAFGVFLGKHPMAPSISPKKSWEGFGGSVFAAAAGSALVLSLMLDVPVYYGALFGVVISCVAVLGDLTESMLKRDLGIKDMSQLLPGHGGLMDRLDSILFAVPVAYLLLWLIAPPG